MMDAFEEGEDAYYEGIAEEDNPYELGTDNYYDWLEGYLDAAEEDGTI